MIIYWIVNFVLSFFPNDPLDKINVPSGVYDFVKHVVYYVPMDVFFTNVMIFIGVLLVAIVVRVIIDLL